MILRLALDVQAAHTMRDGRREAEALLALLAEAGSALDALEATFPEVAGTVDGWRAIERVTGIFPQEAQR